MGRMYIEGFMGIEKNIDVLLEIHLTGNHFPPVSLSFIPTCKKAIDYCNKGKYDKEIKMPNGKTKTASFIVEGLHLDSFIDEE